MKAFLTSYFPLAKISGTRIPYSQGDGEMSSMRREGKEKHWAIHSLCHSSLVARKYQPHPQTEHTRDTTEVTHGHTQICHSIQGNLQQWPFLSGVLTSPTSTPSDPWRSKGKTAASKMFIQRKWKKDRLHLHLPQMLWSLRRRLGVISMLSICKALWSWGNFVPWGKCPDFLSAR